jgi:hypothetical protein
MEDESVPERTRREHRTVVATSAAQMGTLLQYHGMKGWEPVSVIKENANLIAFLKRPASRGLVDVSSGGEIHWAGEEDDP